MSAPRRRRTRRLSPRLGCSMAAICSARSGSSAQAASTAGLSASSSLSGFGAVQPYLLVPADRGRSLSLLVALSRRRGPPVAALKGPGGHEWRTSGPRATGCHCRRSQRLPARSPMPPARREPSTRRTCKAETHRNNENNQGFRRWPNRRRRGRCAIATR